MKNIYRMCVRMCICKCCNITCALAAAPNDHTFRRRVNLYNISVFLHKYYCVNFKKYCLL